MIRRSSTGVRLKRYDGNWQINFTVADSPAVWLKKRAGFFKQFVFSTNNLLRVKSSAGRLAMDVSVSVAGSLPKVFRK